ncbi:MAG: substrate-binding domain-containing protein [Pseudanabaenales cyanobacterium]|nr:substrate-binding domain-containing protein [Pseudanabaenales cyanobacterium]
MIKQAIYVPTLVLVIALANIPKSIALASRNHSLPSQSSHLIAADPSPQTVPSETTPSGTTPSVKTVRIHGSTSMTGINEVLKQRFEHQFSDSNIEIEYTSTDAALAALQQGKIDLAAVGRTLTAGEIEHGLIQVQMSRRKIAVVVGEDNPFEGSLTIEQFAKIFRGEITDWSEVGGEPGPIRFIDRSETSYARQALPSYAVFKDAPFETGDNAEQLDHDAPEATIETMIEALGSDGVSYAIAAQVFERPGVKLVPMHQTLPHDAEYPFSKLLSYVYKGPTPNSAVQKYLTFAADPTNKAMIETARRGGAISSKHGVPSLEAAYHNLSDSESTGKTDKAGASAAGGKAANSEDKADHAYSDSEQALTPTGMFPWWRWFIILPIAGIFFWSLLNRSQGEVDDV